MTNRERAMNILHYKNVDRLPAVHFGYWGELLKEWADQGKIPKELAEDNWDGNQKDKIVMGNVNPVLFKTATPEDIKNEVQKVFDTCSQYENFMISTGCDVPADSKWENLNAYFEKVNELYA